MNNSKLKKIIIFILVVAIFAMSSAYAILYRNLRINGNASVVASWKVEISGIKESTKTGTAFSDSIPTYTVSTATFDARLQAIGDSIDYVVTITNSGKIDAKLASIVTSQTNEDTIIYEIIGVNKDDVLKAGEKIDVTIRVKLNPAITSIDSNISSNVTIFFNYVQSI